MGQNVIPKIRFNSTSSNYPPSMYKEATISNKNSSRLMSKHNMQFQAKTSDIKL